MEGTKTKQKSSLSELSFQQYIVSQISSSGFACQNMRNKIYYQRMNFENTTKNHQVYFDAS